MPPKRHNSDRPLRFEPRFRFRNADRDEALISLEGAHASEIDQGGPHLVGGGQGRKPFTPRLAPWPAAPEPSSGLFGLAMYVLGGFTVLAAWACAHYFL